jgi:acyl-[acyl-carrier-protein]-phospholipid O-acyltransferase/long-chain-fatty-acid--[acyl-carrier-protein] ligase
MYRNFEDKLPPLQPIHKSWIETVNDESFAGKDIGADRISRKRFLMGVLLFSKKIKKISPEQNIGLMLPASMGGAITMMSILAIGKTIVNLNFTSSRTSLINATTQSDLKTIYTSRRFIAKLEKRGMNLLPYFEGINIIYLEDLKKKIGVFSKISALLTTKFSTNKKIYSKHFVNTNLNQTAAILFSSGSESLPKGIELSHRNLAANALQSSIALNASDEDIIMSTLPPFHAFGFLATTLMPLSEGIPIICHPDPTDVVAISDSVYKNQATILVGTPTFLSLYINNKKVSKSKLESLKIIVSGAEKLKEVTSINFNLKFDKTIYQGYGVTECSPAVSINRPNEEGAVYNKMGSVGLPLLGTEFLIVDPKTLEELPVGADGLVLISGPQVMKGYLNNPEKTNEVFTSINDTTWYRTGDKGHIDSDGFLTIVDRYSRFAKIAGEMISLSEVEDYLASMMPNASFEFTALAYPSDKKGEAIGILITQDFTLSELRALLLTVGIPKLHLPTACYVVREIPKLGSGKVDFTKSKSLFIKLNSK